MPDQTTQADVAVLTERLDNFMQSETERHKELDRKFDEFSNRIEAHFSVTVGINGDRRTYRLADLMLDHHRDIKQIKTQLSVMMERRKILDIVQKHPKLSAFIVLLAGMGAYYAGTTGILFTLAKLLKPF